MTDCITRQEEPIETQPDARCRLHEIGHGCAGILRCERDGSGVSPSIRPVKSSVDEMKGRSVEGLVFRRADVASREKNSNEEGKEEDEVRRSR